MSRALIILVVEDEYLLAMEVEELLNTAGWSVAGPAGTLASAVKLARTSAFDAAVLDVNLGGERVDEVAAILSGRGIPFLFMTGYGRDDIPAPYRDNAAHIAKPFRSAKLVDAVRDLLSKVRN